MYAPGGMAGATVPREKQIQDAGNRVLKRRRAWHLTTQSGGYGGLPGMPDKLVCYRGIFLGIEYKRPTTDSKPSVAQKRQLLAIIQAGGLAGVCRSAQDVERMLDAVDFHLDQIDRLAWLEIVEETKMAATSK